MPALQPAPGVQAVRISPKVGLKGGDGRSTYVPDYQRMQQIPAEHEEDVQEGEK